ncbi:MAG: hypothetical protein M1465_00590 [Candidatus Marsarchaeota archaeon]|jgi:hypothetical protein|nr:hypothetical protein [Candidatus Marsarchaeota archaeon]
MGEQKTKRELKNTLLFLGSVVVAIMFITSYAASGNNTNNSSTTTVAYNYSGSVPMIGTVNAIVVNYTNSPTINIEGSYNNTSLGLTKYLNKLVGSGNIITYTPNGNQFAVLLNGSFSAYELQDVLGGIFGNNTSVSGTVYIRLPSKVKLYSGSTGYTLVAPAGEYPVSISPMPTIGSNVSVKVLALISQKGQFVPNQTRVTLAN